MITELQKLRNEIKSLKCQKKVLSSTDIVEGEPVKGCYLLGFNPENGNLFYRDDNDNWAEFDMGTGGVGIQTLDEVLTEGNTSDQSILLTGAGTQFSIDSDFDDSSIAIGPGFISIQNIFGFTATLANDGAGTNTNLFLPASSGTIALLSDIPLGGPLTINTQTSDYTIQLSDGDNNTLIEMDSSSDNVITLDGSTLFDIGTSIMLGSKGGGVTSVVAMGSAVILTPGNVAAEINIENGGAVLTKISATEWLLWGDVGDPVPGLEDVIIANNSLTADRTVTLGSNAISFDNGKVNIGTTTSISGKVLNVVGDTRHGGDVYLDDVGTLNGSSQSLYFKGQTTLGNYQNGRIYYDSNASGGALVLYNDQSNSTAALFNFGLQLNTGRLDTVNTAGLKLTCSSLTSGISLSNGYNQSSGNIFSITNNTSGTPQSIMSITYDGIPKINRLSTSLTAPTTSGTTKMVVTDSNGTLSWANVAGGGDALTTSPLSQFAATTSAQLAGVISDETGSGALVFATSPTLVTPDLGTPSALTLTNATGLPVTTGLSGTGAGVRTFLATPSSANLAAAMTDETGTGSLVFNTNPVFGTKITTPLILGGTSTTQTMTFQTTSGNATTGADFIWTGGNNGATTLATLSAAGVLTLNAGGGITTTGTSSFGNIISTGSVIRTSVSGWFDWGSTNTRIYAPSNGTLQITTSSGTAQTGTLSTGGLITNYVAKTGAYTLTGNDYVVNCTSGTFTVTLPTAVGRAGQDYVIKNSGAGTITIATTSAQTIDGASTITLSVQYGGKRLQSDGANWIVIGSF